ncbi:MAG: porin [Pirellula sp.]
MLARPLDKRRAYRARAWGKSLSWAAIVLCILLGASASSLGQVPDSPAPASPAPNSVAPDSPSGTDASKTQGSSSELTVKETQAPKKALADSPAPKTDPEKWNVKLGGHVQMDYVLWANASDSIPNTFNYFNFRRLRLVADGTGYENCDFRLQMTLDQSPLGTIPPIRI